MIQHVDKYPIYNIFDKEAKFYYYIPKYQREYTWKYAEWEALYDDITENDEGYFIGSIICINQGDVIKPYLEVIDGQQRLTTISLFLAAIYKRLRALKDFMSEDDEDILPSLRKSLRRENSETKIIIVPQIQGRNREDYNYLMSENGLRQTKDVKPSYFGTRRISRCFEYFLGRLDEELAEKSESEQIEILFDRLNRLKNAMLVKIEVNSHSDAYVLFESLNNRGAQLTAIDLLKNLIMARAEKAGMDVDTCFDMWQKLLGFLGDDYKIQERFFRYYYNAFKNNLNMPFRKDDDRKKDPLGVVATKSNLLSIYEKLINRDLKGFLDDILTAAENYQILLYPEKFKGQYSYVDSLIDLNHIQGVPSYILLLYLLYYKEELQITDKLIERIINILVIFFVRRNTTDYPGTRDLARIFMNIITEIEEQDLTANDIYNLVLQRISASSATDEMFIRALEGDIYKTNVDAARYILCALAEKSMTQETWTNLWERKEKDGKYIWTIEHIFPEGENIPQEWVDMIAGGNKTLAQQYLNEYAHKLGNLTMTGYNSNLSNLSFEKKRDRKSPKDQTKYIGYKNGLGINKVLADKNSWTVEDIIQRTDDLSKEVLSLFTFPK